MTVSSPGPSPSPTYLLVGNYGVGNVGDEALREYFLERFPDVAWRIVSQKPQENECPRFPGGLRSFLAFRWLRTVLALRNADGLVFGGGSLFTDSESIRACFLWAVPALVAWVFRKPSFLAFQGIGPFRTSLGERLARWVIAHASFISVRDTASFERLVPLQFSRLSKAHQVQGAEVSTSAKTGAGWKKCTEIIQSFDPTFSLIENVKLNVREKNLLIFIPRVSTRQGVGNICAVLRTWQQERGPVRILSLQSRDPRERERCAVFAGALGTPFESVLSFRDLASSLAGATVVVTERYHGALAALACGVPFLVLRMEEGDKLDALAAHCGCPSETVDSLTEDVLLRTPWGERAEDLPALRKGCLSRVQKGEDTLREALRRFRAA